MTGISSHVLDTALGEPARDLDVTLEVLDEHDVWCHVREATTDATGRVGDLLGSRALERRMYRLSFDTGAYFVRHAEPAFYPRVHVVFRVEDPAQHYHIPLLISPFGYSTYRGS